MHTRPFPERTHAIAEILDSTTLSCTLWEVCTRRPRKVLFDYRHLLQNSQDGMICAP